MEIMFNLSQFKDTAIHNYAVLYSSTRMNTSKFQNLHIAAIFQ
ncbi:hypothetical protein T4B_13529 [Trichinella pseudospiralis]|uniref:Uncharacterized protein n=1 Tax=Trichinella pseudospiralis TaxID=6337 RepID=A0A0V1GIG9_TRIPS|nr:hypothetical protein T4B_13529 [Trichinella pseudospiralis]